MPDHHLRTRVCDVNNLSQAELTFFSYGCAGPERFLQFVTVEMPSTKVRKKRGRPATGPGGERVSDYPQVMIRLPQPTKATLDALSSVTGVPVWRLVDRAVRAYVESLPVKDRKLIGAVRVARARPTRH